MAVLNVKVGILKLGQGYLALTRLGGMEFKGRRAGEPHLAVRNLFYVLGGSDGQQDSDLGIELEIAGTNLEAELEQAIGAERQLEEGKA